LTVSPALFDVLEGDVGRHACRNAAYGRVDPFLVSVEQVGTGQPKDTQQVVDVDPHRVRVIVGELELVLFARQRQPFDQAWVPIDAREPAAPVFYAACDHLDGHGRPREDMFSQERWVHVHAERVDVVHHQAAELRAVPQQARQDAVLEQVGDLEPVTNRVQALEGNVVRIIGPLARVVGPVDERGV